MLETQRHVTGDVRIRFRGARFHANRWSAQPSRALRLRTGDLRRGRQFQHADSEGLSRSTDWASRPGPRDRARKRDATALMTLWSGRFSSPMAASLWELSESYSFDHMLYAHDIMGIQGARAWASRHAASLSDDERQSCCSIRSTIIDRVRERRLRSRRERRRYSHGDRTPRDGIGLGRLGAKIHTATQSQRPSRDDTAPCSLVTPSPRSRAILELVDALSALGTRSTPTRTCLVTRTYNAPSRSCRIIWTPTPGLYCATSIGWCDTRRAPQRVASRRRRPGWHFTADSTSADSRASRLSRARSPIPSTPSATATSSPRRSLTSRW
jgi:hypothetical protein